MTTELWIAFAGLMFAIFTQTLVVARSSGKTAQLIESLAKDHEAIWTTIRTHGRRAEHHHVRIVRLEDNAGLDAPQQDV